MAGALITTYHWRKSFRKLLKNYVRKPMNSILIALIALGVILLVLSGSMHPVASTVLSQKQAYAVSPQVTNQSAFTVFSNKTTFAKFSMPRGQSVEYSLMYLIQVKETAAGHGSAVRDVWVSLANGTAHNGTLLRVHPKKLPFTITTQLEIYSTTAGSYNVTVESYAYYNSTLKFSPNYAISGLALTVGSATVIASVAGMKFDEM